MHISLYAKAVKRLEANNKPIWTEANKPEKKTMNDADTFLFSTFRKRNFIHSTNASLLLARSLALSPSVCHFSLSLSISLVYYTSLNIHYTIFILNMWYRQISGTIYAWMHVPIWILVLSRGACIRIHQSRRIRTLSPFPKQKLHASETLVDVVDSLCIKCYSYYACKFNWIYCVNSEHFIYTSALKLCALTICKRESIMYETIKNPSQHIKFYRSPVAVHT